jgi:hypothetical protein
MELSPESGNLNEIFNEPGFQKSVPDTNYLKGITSTQNNAISIPVTQALNTLRLAQKGKGFGSADNGCKEYFYEMLLDFDNCTNIQPQPS